MQQLHQWEKRHAFSRQQTYKIEKDSHPHSDYRWKVCHGTHFMRLLLDFSRSYWNFCVFRLYGVLNESHFDYLFFDEVGQAEEPLALVPITGLLKRGPKKILGSLVLAGDPKQLGPIIHSRMASVLGLGEYFIFKFAIYPDVSVWFTIANIFCNSRYFFDWEVNDQFWPLPKEKRRL